MRVRAKVLTTAGVVAREIGIANGRVTALEPLGSDLQGDDTITLADDETLIPGLVDAHVHVNEPGRTDWEGFSSATKAAAAGGVTTILEMPLNSIPSTVNGPALELKQYVAASQAFADVGFWGGLSWQQEVPPRAPRRRRLRFQVLSAALRGRRVPSAGP